MIAPYLLFASNGLGWNYFSLFQSFVVVSQKSVGSIDCCLFYAFRISTRLAAVCERVKGCSVNWSVGISEINGSSPAKKASHWYSELNINRERWPSTLVFDLLISVFTHPANMQNFSKWRGDSRNYFPPYYLTTFGQKRAVIFGRQGYSIGPTCCEQMSSKEQSNRKGHCPDCHFLASVAFRALFFLAFRVVVFECKLDEDLCKPVFLHTFVDQKNISRL